RVKGGRKNWDEHETTTTNDTPREGRNNRRSLLLNGGKLGGRPGDVEASFLAEVNFAILANGEAPFTVYETFTGTVAGRGAGSFTVFEVDSVAPNGHVTGNWRIVKGSATGGLVGMTGGGKAIGTYDSTTGLVTGVLSGVLHFSK
ncbi:MAG: DUF3224 domain-containing protein, partial [Candidatus Binataceae bacterium]